MSLAICNANSLVGANTKSCILRLVSSIISKIGKENAAVFPVPVCARAIRSLMSDKMKGIVCFWISVGLS